jgi:hypothetical protein
VAVGSVEGFGGASTGSSVASPASALTGHHSAAELAIAGIASAGAGAIHVAAWGAHSDATTLAVLFIVLAIAQLEVAVAGFVRPNKLTAGALAAVNLAAAAGWITTRFVGISWIDGLQQAEDPGLADTIAAVLAGVAVVSAASHFGTRDESRPSRSLPITAIAAMAAALTIPAVVDATSHEHRDAAGTTDHEHADGAATDAGHAHTGDAAATDGNGDAQPTDPAAAGNDGAAPVAVGDDHGHTGDEAVAAAAWPRAWDPSGPIDFSGVAGVTAEQQARAEQLARDTLDELPQFADVSTIGALGYRSIGDSSTGFEHYINPGLIFDNVWLDPSQPESLVYQADGDQRTLVSAMFIANTRPLDDPELVGYGGSLMQWHVHDNLCWGLDDSGNPVVKSLTDDAGNCPAGTIKAGGENPMVHVWIAPHECGPFAALEGHGAGQVDGDGQRVDQCAHDDGHGSTAAGDVAASRPYDPNLPIDLGGVEGVTPQQQAFAENLVGATVRDLPQWSDPAVAEAAGFRSIGDGLTGHEHYIQWDWIDDDVWLDPDFPESLVYEPQPDGTKKLVSAMFMLRTDTPLADVPDWGGTLMQWHIHDDLCFTDDPDAPQVGSVTTAAGTCSPPLVKFAPAPMIHVWIVPHACGPFAALEGVGAGQILDGEQRWCDTAHGAH